MYMNNGFFTEYFYLLWAQFLEVLPSEEGSGKVIKDRLT